MSSSARPSPTRVALVLAGSRGGIDPVAEVSRKSVKAFAEIGGRPMIERVLSTLHSSGLFDSIQVSLPAGLPLAEECPQLDQWIQTGEVIRQNPAASPSESVLEVLERIEDGGTLVVTTADHPLLTVESLTTFLDRFRAGQAGASAALTSADAIRERYPDMRRTALRFRDGNLAGCNLFAFAGSAGVPVVRFWRQLEQHRKNPLRVARFLGFGALVLYQFRLLTLGGAIRRLEKKTGVNLLAIRLDDPHMGIDVDTPEDLQRVRAILETENP
jgi:CTP:molybdopterin cytidylyltransferase MocA